MKHPLEELFENKQILTEGEKTLRYLHNKRGVLLFVDFQNHPVQLLLSAGIRRTVLAKWFQSSPTEPNRKADLHSIAAAVYYTLLPSEYHSLWFYSRLVHLLFPEQAEELLNLPAAHCVCLNPAEPWAAFVPSTHPFKEKGAFYGGPFPTRSEADFFSRTFNTLFSLCRNRPLASSGKGSKCSYFQMNLCTAPCLKNKDNDLYQKAIQQALRAARSPLTVLTDALTEKMKMLAAQLRFEQAQTIKNQIKSLEKLQTAPYRWTADLDALKILHICKGPSIASPKKSVYQSFLITGRTAEKLPNFTLDSIEYFLKIPDCPPNRFLLCRQNPSEHVSLTSLFLYKTCPPGLWLNLTHSPMPDPSTLSMQIQKTCEKTSPKNQ